MPRYAYNSKVLGFGFQHVSFFLEWEGLSQITVFHGEEDLVTWRWLHDDRSVGLGFLISHHFNLLIMVQKVSVCAF